MTSSHPFYDFIIQQKCELNFNKLFFFAKNIANTLKEKKYF